MPRLHLLLLALLLAAITHPAAANQIDLSTVPARDTVQTSPSSARRAAWFLKKATTRCSSAGPTR